MSLCIVSLAHSDGVEIITVQQRSTVKPKILTFERRLFVGTGGSSSRCRVPGPPSWSRSEFRALFLPTLVASLRSLSFRSPGALQRCRPPSPPVGRRASLRFTAAACGILEFAADLPYLSAITAQKVSGVSFVTAFSFLASLLNSALPPQGHSRGHSRLPSDLISLSVSI